MTEGISDTRSGDEDIHEVAFVDNESRATRPWQIERHAAREVEDRKTKTTNSSISVQGGCRLAEDPRHS